jgi:hypothetical protein
VERFGIQDKVRFHFLIQYIKSGQADKYFVCGDMCNCKQQCRKQPGDGQGSQAIEVAAIQRQSPLDTMLCPYPQFNCPGNPPTAWDTEEANSTHNVYSLPPR